MVEERLGRLHPPARVLLRPPRRLSLDEQRFPASGIWLEADAQTGTPSKFDARLRQHYAKER